MDHYVKKQSRYVEDQPLLPNELRITATGKPRDIVNKALKLMKSFPDEGVVISATGGHVTKAVTTVELMKRTNGDQFYQETQLKYVRVEDTWEPDVEGLDILTVVRRIPSISMVMKPMTLCKPETMKSPHRTTVSSTKSKDK